MTVRGQFSLDLVIAGVLSRARFEGASSLERDPKAEPIVLAVWEW